VTLPHLTPSDSPHYTYSPPSLTFLPYLCPTLRYDLRIHHVTGLPHGPTFRITGDSTLRYRIYLFTATRSTLHCLPLRTLFTALPTVTPTFPHSHRYTRSFWTTFSAVWVLPLLLHHFALRYYAIRCLRVTHSHSLRYSSVGLGCPFTHFVTACLR